MQAVRAGTPHVVSMGTSHIRVRVELDLQELGKGEDEGIGRHHSDGCGLTGGEEKEQHM